MTYTRMVDKVLHTEPSNLVACWAGFGESGAVLYDFARFGRPTRHDGAISGGVTRSTTQRGYDFDGVDGRINIASVRNPNLLLNGYFEVGGPNWTSWTENAGDGAIADEAALMHEAAHACKLTSGASADTYVHQGSNAVPGQPYRLKIWTRTAIGDNAGRYAVYDNSNTEWITPITSTGVSGAVYERLVHEFVAPAGCVSQP